MKFPMRDEKRNAWVRRWLEENGVDPGSVQEGSIGYMPGDSVAHYTHVSPDGDGFVATPKTFQVRVPLTDVPFEPE